MEALTYRYRPVIFSRFILSQVAFNWDLTLTKWVWHIKVSYEISMLMIIVPRVFSTYLNMFLIILCQFNMFKPPRILPKCNFLPKITILKNIRNFEWKSENLGKIPFQKWWSLKYNWEVCGGHKDSVRELRHCFTS